MIIMMLTIMVVVIVLTSRMTATMSRILMRMNMILMMNTVHRILRLLSMTENMHIAHVNFKKSYGIAPITVIGGAAVCISCSR